MQVPGAAKQSHSLQERSDSQHAGKAGQWILPDCGEVVQATMTACSNDIRRCGRPGT